MPAVVDHIFICTTVGAPAAERLREFGLVEGSPNRHPGQGTANRRFFFRNAMLELLWIEDAAEAQSDQTRRTRLWERWSQAGRAASPFGIILRPASGSQEECPFPSWEYRPRYMPPGLSLHIAEGASLDEPMWCYMETQGRSQAVDHPAGFREITGVRVVGPSLAEASVTLAMARAGVIEAATGGEHLLELQFDGGRTTARDFRPDLPLLFR